MTMSGAVYIASAGETWDSISLVIYRDEIFAADLLCANPSLCDIMVFEGGEVVRVPVVTEQGGIETSDGETYEPAAAPWKE